MSAFGFGNCHDEWRHCTALCDRSQVGLCLPTHPPTPSVFAFALCCVALQDKVPTAERLLLL